MKESSSLVTIGMRLHNPDRYLSGALDSLLAQDYQNYELIISDNASTDNTEQICRAYAARDPRIRYCRNQENIRGFRNRNKLMKMATGKALEFVQANEDYVIEEPPFLCNEGILNVE